MKRIEEETKKMPDFMSYKQWRLVNKARLTESFTVNLGVKPMQNMGLNGSHFMGSGDELYMKKMKKNVPVPVEDDDEDMEDVDGVHQDGEEGEDNFDTDDQGQEDAGLDDQGDDEGDEGFDDNEDLGDDFNPDADAEFEDDGDDDDDDDSDDDEGFEDEEGDEEGDDLDSFKPHDNSAFMHRMSDGNFKLPCCDKCKKHRCSCVKKESTEDFLRKISSYHSDPHAKYWDGLKQNEEALLPPDVKDNPFMSDEDGTIAEKDG